MRTKTQNHKVPACCSIRWWMEERERWFPSLFFFQRFLKRDAFGSEISGIYTCTWMRRGDCTFAREMTKRGNLNFISKREKAKNGNNCGRTWNLHIGWVYTLASGDELIIILLPKNNLISRQIAWSIVFLWFSFDHIWEQIFLVDATGEKQPILSLPYNSLSLW